MPLWGKIVFDLVLMSMGLIGLIYGLVNVATDLRALIAIASGAMIFSGGIYFLVKDV